MLRAEGVSINRKRVQRLMRRMGIAALGPKPRTTKSAPGHMADSSARRNTVFVGPTEPTDQTVLPQSVEVSDSNSSKVPEWNENASVLGSVKHEPLARRPAALLDLPCARLPGIAQVGTAGWVAFQSNIRIAMLS